MPASGRDYNCVPNQIHTMQQKHKSSFEHISLGLTAYRKLASTGHEFDPEMLYTFADIGRLTGVSAMGIRQRAIYDQWPTVSVHVAKGQAKRAHYVSGAFLAEVKAAAKRWSNGAEAMLAA